MRTCALALFFVLLTFFRPTAAQETLLESVLDACEGDIEQYCSDVTPGEGRMLFCMAAYQDQITPQCEYALYEAAAVLEALSNAIVYVAEACANDIEEHCADVAVGEGRILACLEQNSAELEGGCQEALDETVGE